MKRRSSRRGEVKRTFQDKGESEAKKRFPVSEATLLTLDKWAAVSFLDFYFHMVTWGLETATQAF